MSGLPLLATPSVLMVGPGESATYGTGTSARATASTTMASSETSSVTARRDMTSAYATDRWLPLRVALDEVAQGARTLVAVAVAVDRGLGPLLGRLLSVRV